MRDKYAINIMINKCQMLHLDLLEERREKHVKMKIIESRDIVRVTGRGQTETVIAQNFEKSTHL